MKHRLSLAPGLVMVLCATLGCSVDVPAEDESRLELYRVPAGMEGQVRRLLAMTLQGSNDAPARGAVADAPDGRLLVLTTPRIHAGVAELIESLADAEPPRPPSPIELTYWVVIGEPSPGQPLAPDALPEIAPALAAIAEELGPHRFRLLERLQVRGQSGDEAFAKGVRVDVEQQAGVVADRVVARVGVAVTGLPAQVRTEVSLAPGELVVLAQTGSPLRESREARAEEPRLLFYIVRARLLDD